jgi:hypothetical protein
MSRKLMALLVSSTMALGSISTSGWSAPASIRQIGASGVQAALPETRNVPPLAPAGAAGIREAQGSGGNELYIIGGFIVVFALLWVIDNGNDDDDVPSSSGTH